MPPMRFFILAEFLICLFLLTILSAMYCLTRPIQEVVVARLTPTERPFSPPGRARPRPGSAAGKLKTGKKHDKL
jgi:hypothetical protein